MQRTMPGVGTITVFVNEGDLISIKQDNDYEQACDIVQIAPWQVDTIVKWLQECRAEIIGKEE